MGKIAIIHDHLAQDGGAERVLKVFQDMFPDAPTFVLVYDKKNAGKWFLHKDIRTSFIQKLPFGLRRYQWYLPAMPAAIESYDLSEFDVILSSSSSFAKGIISKPHATHICYCHTPARFLWSDTHEYIRDLRVPALLRSITKLILPNIRQWDKLSTDRVDHFISNSNTVKDRIKKYYNRDSQVIYPPISIKDYMMAQPKRFYLAGGRLVAYKRFDITIQAFNRLRLPLYVFGDGPEKKGLEKIAQKNITFLGKVSEQTKKELFSQALAFINPQEEDFGITMIESLASGRPVIAYKAGGATEILEEGINGMFFEEQTATSLTHALEQFQHKYLSFQTDQIRRSAQKYDTDRFKQSMRELFDTLNIPLQEV